MSKPVCVEERDGGGVSAADCPTVYADQIEQFHEMLLVFFFFLHQLMVDQQIETGFRNGMAQ